MARRPRSSSAARPAETHSARYSPPRSQAGAHASLADLQRRVTQLEATIHPAPSDPGAVPAVAVSINAKASAPGQRTAAFLAAQRTSDVRDITDHELPSHTTPSSGELTAASQSGASDVGFSKPIANSAATYPTPVVAAPYQPAQRPISQSRRPLPERSGINFEELLAGRWYAALGALAVVIATSLFVKLGYDQGWLRVSPFWRCVGAASFGVALVALAEWVSKRWGSWAASGSASAGLGTVYASVFAAYKLYDMLSPVQGVAIMLAVAVLGTLVGVRLRLTFVVAVSLAGGYLAPILIRGSHVSVVALPAYTLCLLIIGLASCTWLEHRHAVKSSAGVRALAAIGAGILLSLWAFDSSVPLLASITAIALAWLLVHADAVVNAWLVPQSPEAHEDDRLPRELLPRAQSLVFATLAVTSWAVALAMYLLAHAGAGSVWTAPLAVCAASALLAGVLAPFGASISRLPATLRHVVGQAMLLQCAMLFIVIIAAALGGFAQITAFAVVGLAAAVMGHRLSAPAMRIYGFVLLSLATLSFLLTRAFHLPLGFPRWEIAGLILTWSSLFAVLLAAAWAAALSIGRSETGSIRASLTRAPVPFLLLLLVPLHSAAQATSVLWVWITLALLLSFLRAPRALRLDLASLLVVFAAAALWLLLYASSMLKTGWYETSAAHIALAGIVLAAITSFITWRNRIELTDHAFVLHCASGLLAFIASSLGISALTQTLFNAQTSTRGAVSVWWAIAAVLTLAAGFRWSKPALRYISLALLGLTAGKVVIYDMTAVSPIWRIATFLVVGLIMMGVAFVYGRLSKQAEATIK